MEMGGEASPVKTEVSEVLHVKYKRKVFYSVVHMSARVHIQPWVLHSRKDVHRMDIGGEQ